jgi:hypothetical protein
MKLAWKIIKWLLIIVGSLLMVLLVLSSVFEKNIADIFLKELNRRLVIPANAREINFSLIKGFPHASNLRIFLLKALKNTGTQPSIATTGIPYSLPGNSECPSR